ncbi:MAG: hypothetical protein ACTSRW_14445 [Candidatus Helarchaeota archaeon]
MNEQVLKSYMHEVIYCLINRNIELREKLEEQKKINALLKRTLD